MISDTPSFTITVPAFNEEGAIGPTLDAILAVLRETPANYEILVFDDASRDQTGAIADQYAARHSSIQVIHNAKNMGIGYAYREGLRLAKKSHYTLIHGDNEISKTLMRDMFRSVGQKDFTTTYIARDTRPLSRRLISKTFTSLVNGMFGLRVRYYNGPSLIPVKYLREIQILTNGHAFMAEIIVKLSKRGYRHTEVGFETIIRPKGKSKAFRIKNVLSVIQALWDLRRTSWKKSRDN